MISVSATIIFFLRCLGVLIAASERTPLRNLNENYCAFSRKEKRKKTSKFSIHSSLPVGRPSLRSRSSFLLIIWLSFFLFFLFKKIKLNFLNQPHYAKFHHKNPPKRHYLQGKPNLYPQQRNELWKWSEAEFTNSKKTIITHR